MPNVFFQEFRDVNRTSKYPFTDTAALTDTSGTLILPNSLFLDASFYIAGNTELLHLQSIKKTLDSCIIVVSNKDKKYQASCTVLLTSHETTLTFLTNNIKSGCIIVSSDGLDFIANIPSGEYTFSYKATPFVVRCVVPVPNAAEKLTSIQVAGFTRIDGSKPEDYITLYGDVHLVGGYGVYLETHGNVITVAIPGERNSGISHCNQEASEPVFLRTINGQSGSIYGSILFSSRSNVSSGETRSRLSASKDNGIRLKQIW